MHDWRYGSNSRRLSDPHLGFRRRFHARRERALVNEHWLGIAGSPYRSQRSDPRSSLRQRYRREIARTVPDSHIMKSIRPEALTPGQVAREFRQRLDAGMQLLPAGSAKKNPLQLLSAGYTPKHKLSLFGAGFYLTHLRIDENFRFFVAYVVLPAKPKRAYPRIFYKDSSLVWRSATHYIRSENENWIGKGETKWTREGDDLVLASAEETTNLPFEMQYALDLASRAGGKPRRDTRATDLVLRRAPDDRIEPYNDFSGPRKRARANRKDLVNRGKPIAVFRTHGDPTSLQFVRGFEPDFDRGRIDETVSKSRIYGGTIRKFRILSQNRAIQYQFVAAPRHVWIIPPQTTAPDLTSYGVRTIDVETDEDLCVPGYEYHFIDPHEDPPKLFSQIPPGFAGPTSSVDPDRADASAWIEALPVIHEFRRAVLGADSRRQRTRR